MTISTFQRKEFEAVFIPYTSNDTYISIDWLNADGSVQGPLDASVYERFACHATPYPTAENPEPTPVLVFSVVRLSGFVVEGDTDPHPGAFLLLCDPDASAVLQQQYVRNGLVDLIGITATGHRNYLARGFFTTEMVATRSFV